MSGGRVPAGVILSPLQIVSTCVAAGFTGTDQITMAVAVALAESGGNPNRISLPNNDAWHSVDRGLFQINSHWHAEVSDADALAPVPAARAALAISHGGTNWSGWTSSHNGAASAQLGRAQAAVAQYRQTNPAAIDPGSQLAQGVKAAGGSTASTSLSWTDAVVSLGEGVVKTAHWVSDSHNWIRILEVIGGAAALLLGLAMIANSGVGGPVGAVARTTTKATHTAAKGAALAAL